MKKARRASPRSLCIVIAGPNGAGKTTFARDFLPKEAAVVHFVNADLIASGLSPLKPDDAPPVRQWLRAGSSSPSWIALPALARVLHSKAR